MGWSTDLFCNIHFNKKTYNTLYEVESDIESLNSLIKVCETTIRDMVLSQNPAIFMEKDDKTAPYYTLSTLVDENLECLKEYYTEREYLYILRDNWSNCHDKETGLAINPPKDINYDTAYLEGDFVNTIENPKSNSL